MGMGRHMSCYGWAWMGIGHYSWVWFGYEYKFEGNVGPYYQVLFKWPSSPIDPSTTMHISLSLTTSLNTINPSDL